MKKTALPLPESFIVHATALVNHVHGKSATQEDAHSVALASARSRRFSLTVMELAPLPPVSTPQMMDLRQK